MHPSAIDYLKLAEEIDWYLSPTILDGATRWRHGGAAPQITSNDAMNRARAFIAASNEIRAFIEKVGTPVEEEQPIPSGAGKHENGADPLESSAPQRGRKAAHAKSFT